MELKDRLHKILTNPWVILAGAVALALIAILTDKGGA
jgi:hypothetical protein